MKFSIIKLSGVKASSKMVRIDAEYFHPDFLETENMLRQHNHTELRALILPITDYHANGSYELLRKNVMLSSEVDFAYMIRAVDFERRDFEKDVIYVNKHAYEFLKKTKIYGKEIIISKIGNAGHVYIVPPMNKKVTLGMNLFLIKSNSDINNQYIYCFLASKYGQNQLQQRITGAVPLSIDKESVKSIIVPIFSTKIQKLVSWTFDLHFQFYLQMKEKELEIETLLNNEFDMEFVTDKKQTTYIRLFSTIKRANRLDAEYFHPKYENLNEKITNYEGGWEKLNDLVDMYKGFEVGSHEYFSKGIPYVRVSDLCPWFVSEGKYISSDLYNKIISYQPKQNDILLSKDGSPCIAYYIDEYPEKMITCSGIVCLRKKSQKVNHQFLVAMLNSRIVSEQCKRDVGGSIILHWRIDQIKEVIIPIFTEKQQKIIQHKVIERNHLQKKSDFYERISKHIIELALEKDEETAIEWLNARIRDININCSP